MPLFTTLFATFEYTFCATKESEDPVLSQIPVVAVLKVLFKTETRFAGPSTTTLVDVSGSRMLMK